jgi:hypothetical protein
MIFRAKGFDFVHTVFIASGISVDAAGFHRYNAALYRFI